jgi:ribose transport system substrate-binding protein
MKSAPRVVGHGRAMGLVAGALLALLAVGCGGGGGGQNPPGGSSTSTAPSGARAPGGAPGAGGTLEIAVIPKGTTHEYWKSIHAGAIKAQQQEAKMGVKVDIKWQGPLKEDDKNAQVDLVESFISQKVNGIVLAPLDEHALVRPVDEAVKAGVPVVIIDSALDTNSYACMVATNNEKGGELAGQRLVQLLGGKGRIIMLRYEEGSASTEDREKGFMTVIQKSPGITVLSSNQHAGATVDTAYEASQNLISQFGSQVDGIYTPNESSTRGMLRALQQAGKLGKVKFVGFDSSKDLVDALKAKQIQGLVVQDPMKMGFLGVLTMVRVIKKQPVEKSIDTGVTLVTPENMNNPDMNALLNPPFAQYLK